MSKAARSIDARITKSWRRMRNSSSDSSSLRSWRWWVMVGGEGCRGVAPTMDRGLVFAFSWQDTAESEEERFAVLLLCSLQQIASALCLQQQQRVSAAHSLTPLSAHRGHSSGVAVDKKNVQLCWLCCRPLLLFSSMLCSRSQRIHFS